MGHAAGTHPAWRAGIFRREWFKAA